MRGWVSQPLLFREGEVGPKHRERNLRDREVPGPVVLKLVQLVQVLAKLRRRRKNDPNARLSQRRRSLSRVVK